MNWRKNKIIEKKNTVPFSIKLFIFWSSSELFGEPEPMSEDRMKWIYKDICLTQNQCINRSFEFKENTKIY